MALVQPEQATAVQQDLNFEAEVRVAQMLLKSGLCPTSVKTPEAALFLILTGRDLGLSPVQSLRSIAVIQGKVELAADLQLALFVKRGGRFTWAQLNDKGAVLKLVWQGNEATSSFTLQDAARAGLVNGDNWRKYPRAMCRSRAITQGMKDVGFDGLSGVYAPGEIGGAEVVEITDVVVEPARPANVDADGVVTEDLTGKATAPSPSSSTTTDGASFETSSATHTTKTVMVEPPRIVSLLPGTDTHWKDKTGHGWGGRLIDDAPDEVLLDARTYYQKNPTKNARLLDTIEAVLDRRRELADASRPDPSDPRSFDTIPESLAQYEGDGQ